MRNILILTNHLQNFAGSEIITTELAEYFDKNDWKVDICTNFFSMPISEEVIYQKINVYVVGRDEIPNPFDYDIVWSQHFLLPQVIFNHLENANNYKTKFIFAHLSPFEGFESRGFICETLFADKIIANSVETKNKMISLGLSKDNIDIFYNAAPKEFDFTKKYTNQPLKKIAIISNHPPEEIKEAMIKLQEKGIEVSLYSIQEQGYQRITPKIIQTVDAVITIGKSVQYAIKSTVPVYNYDHFGGPGWLNLENYEKAEDYNYSGRSHAVKKYVDNIVKELLFGFSKACEDISLIKEKTETKYSLEAFLSQLINNIEHAKVKSLELTDNQKQALEAEVILMNVIQRESQLRMIFANENYDLTNKISLKDAELLEKIDVLHKKDLEIASLSEHLNQKNIEINNRIEILQQKDIEIASLTEHLNQKNIEINNRIEVLQQKDAKLSYHIQLSQQKSQEVINMLNSTSWKITRPLRFVKNRGKQGLQVIKQEGLISFIRKTIRYSLLKLKIIDLPKEIIKEEVIEQIVPDKQLIEYTEERFLQAKIKLTEQITYVTKSIDTMEGTELPVKTIAFYLPQFHPFKENNEWWGDGFTEWTNVSKANPQFLGHEQPKMPGEMGFYDLRLTSEVMRKQIDLAKRYGVKGFCFHHYWFGGKRLMETPVDNFLKDKSLDIEFCLCWANENWTRRWDGLEGDILIGQNHSDEDDKAFFENLLPYLQDDRYIKINGKPLVIVYRTNILPNPQKTADLWRKMAQDAGFNGLYLVSAKSFDNGNPLDVGFDAAVEFPPHQIQADVITDQMNIFNKEYQGAIYSYPSLVENECQKKYPGYVNFKTVFPSWDNEARKPGKGNSFYGSTPELYAKWLSYAVDYSVKNPPEENSGSLVFVNAWNEWAEGAYLEPDRKYGYAYLHATANVLRNYACTENNQIQEINADFTKKYDSVIVLHAYYEDVALDLIEEYLLPLKEKVDFIFTVKPDVSSEFIETVKEKLENVYFVLTQNRGRDIRPFIQALPVIEKFAYEFICKIHTKKSPHRDDGDFLRNKLIQSLLSKESFDLFLKESIDENIGFWAPEGSLIAMSTDDYYMGNITWLTKLCKKLNITIDDLKYNSFAAGSMFWCRTDAILNLKDLVDLNDFELEAGQVDGTLAHAIERIFILLSLNNGYQYKELTNRE